MNRLVLPGGFFMSGFFALFPYRFTKLIFAEDEI